MQPLKAVGQLRCQRNSTILIFFLGDIFFAFVVYKPHQLTSCFGVTVPTLNKFMVSTLISADRPSFHFCC